MAPTTKARTAKVHHTSPPMRAGQRDGLAAAAGSIVVLAVALLLAPARDALGLANVALRLTLVVVGAASIGGRTAGVTTAVVGALGFNAIHVRPYGTLRVDRTEDLLTCVLMIVVGVAVGQLAHMAVDRGRRASSDRTGIRHVSELRELVAEHAPPEVLIERSGGYLVEQLGLTSYYFVWGGSTSIGFGDLPPDLERNGAIPGPMRHGHGGFQLPAEGVSLPVTGRDGSVVGRFVLEPTPGHGVALADRELAVLVSDVIAPALEAAPTPGGRTGHTTASRTGTNG